MRFLVFAGDQYYPSGGGRDFIAAFDTEAEAYTYGLGLKEGRDWVHVFDAQLLRVCIDFWKKERVG